MHCSSESRLTVYKAICRYPIVSRITHLWEQITILRYAFPYTRTLLNANHQDVRDQSARFAALILFVAHHLTTFATPHIALYYSLWNFSRRCRPFEYAERAVTI